MKNHEENYNWKISEDLLLKYSVLKFGSNKWFKISTLLQEKNLKQCRFRWYNWLDGKIKKKTWDQAEDRKAVYFFKKFPNQWKSMGLFLRRNSLQIFYRILFLKNLKKEKKNNLAKFQKTQPISFLSIKKKGVDESLSITKYRFVNQLGKKTIKKIQMNRKNFLKGYQGINAKKSKKKKKNHIANSENLSDRHKSFDFLMFFIFQKYSKKSCSLKKKNPFSKKGFAFHTLFYRMVGYF